MSETTCKCGHELNQHLLAGGRCEQGGCACRLFVTPTPPSGEREATDDVNYAHEPRGMLAWVERFGHSIMCYPCSTPGQPYQFVVGDGAPSATVMGAYENARFDYSESPTPPSRERGEAYKCSCGCVCAEHMDAIEDAITRDAEVVERNGEITRLTERLAELERELELPAGLATVEALLDYVQSAGVENPDPIRQRLRAALRAERERVVRWCWKEWSGGMRYDFDEEAEVTRALADLDKEATR